MARKKYASQERHEAKRRALPLSPASAHLVCTSQIPQDLTSSSCSIEFILTSTCYLPLNILEIDLKVAAKFFGTKFACGSSVTGDDEIVIQGDVKDDLFDVIPEKWPEIDEDLIDDLGDLKRT